MTVEGNFATTYENVGSVLNPVLAVYQLKDGKIFRLWQFELGSTRPFNTAVMP